MESLKLGQMMLGVKRGGRASEDMGLGVLCETSTAGESETWAQAAASFLGPGCGHNASGNPSLQP